MKNFENLSDIIINASSETGQIIRMMETIPGMFDEVAQKWVQTCQSIPVQINSGLLKIAVAGTIKSGKSTFINALIEKDLVQRGAGVVTAVTTRIRKGKKNRARIYLKSWDDINSDIINALLFFPGIESEQQTIDQFDIRRQKDRTFLQSVYEKMIRVFSGNTSGLSPEIKLIQHALQGFEACRDAVQADDTVLEFTGRQFERHRDYSADLSRAFFVKDIQLDMVSGKLDRQVEIADCQGSDSTDPGQAIHIQNYLESAHLIIYLISSRTGLRQADILFLTRIRQMGLSEQILFVNNVDLSEHEHLKDLKKVEQDIIRELKYVIDEPLVFSFSSLFIFFSNTGSRLVSKDKKRLALWQEEKQMVDYCRKMNQSFIDHLNIRLEKDRFCLLIANPLERLSLIVHSGIKKVCFFSDIFSENSQQAAEAIAQLKYDEERALKLESIVDHSLTGATEGITRKINVEVTRFFSAGAGQAAKDIEQFVHHYSFSQDSYPKTMNSSGVQAAAYLMFQDFRSELDLFITQQVQPRLMGFVNMMEKEIDAYVQSLMHASLIDISGQHAVNDNNLSKEIRDSNSGEKFLSRVDLSGIKKILGLKIPVIRIDFRYNARIKISVLTAFGLQSLQRIAFMLFKHQKTGYVPSALHPTAERIKQQTLNLLPACLDNYKQDLLLNFFNPLITAVIRDLKEKISQTYRLFDNRTRMAQARHKENQVFNKERNDHLDMIAAKLRRVQEKIDRVSLKYRG